MSGVAKSGYSIKQHPFQTPIRSFASEAAEKKAETPRGPLGAVFSFLPRWGAPYIFTFFIMIEVFGENWVFTFV